MGENLGPFSGKVLIVDDDAVIRDTLYQVLTKQGYMVKLAVDIDSARAAVLDTFYDLILLDIVFSDQQYSGFDIMRHIRKRQCHCPVVLITGVPSFEAAVKALHENVFDFLTKPFSNHEILSVLNRAIEHNKRLNGVGRYEEPLIRSGSLELLSKREKELLGLFIKGFSYSEAAQLMTCKVSTIQSYTKNIYTKLGVHSRAEAVHEVLNLQNYEI